MEPNDIDQAERDLRDEVAKARENQTRQMEERLRAFDRDRQRRLTREIEAARREARRG